MNKISVIVPCYNEEEALPLFYEETKNVLGQMKDVDYELIFIDDGSRDCTPDVMAELAETDAHCRYVIFSRNFGKEAAMYAGLREAKGNYCVIMDADLQHPPALLPQMYRAVSQEGYDCCGGFRKGREGDGWLRSLFSKAFYKISKGLTHMDMADGHGDFRMMARPMVDAILEMKEYNRYMKGLFSFVGFNTKWITFDNVERTCGSTKWSFKSLFAYAIEGILSFSTAPLKLAGIMAALLFLGSVLFCTGNLLAEIWRPGAFSSFDLILTAVLFLASLQMFFLYILGAYLSKDYLENKNRPIYIVKERG